MRTLVIAVVPVALVALVAPGAPPSASAETLDPDAYDTSELKGVFTVLHDGKGHYIVVHQKDAKSMIDHMFYGDGTTFYLQRSPGGGRGPSGLNLRFWAPRVKLKGDLVQRQGTWHVTCGERKTQLAVMDRADARKLVERARFRQPLHKHRSYLLARDSRGNYYYVDRLRDAYGGKGFRLWVGPVGNMKRMKMTNIVSDSEGDIFATKKGELRLISSNREQTSTWVKGKKKRKLVNVPVDHFTNMSLIYNDLGVYLGDLGNPCDHL